MGILDLLRSKKPSNTEAMPFAPLQRSGPPLPGYSSGSGIGTGMGWFGRLPGTNHDWWTEAGPPELNSIVYACLIWKSQQALEALPMVQRKRGKEYIEVQEDFGFINFLETPNDYYGWEEFLTAFIASHDIAGNAYAIKVRDGNRKPRQIWWVPSHMIGPEWDANQRQWTKFYRYTTAGGSYLLPPEDVLHVRAPILNRNNVRLGQSAIEAVIRDIAGDNGAASLYANVFGMNGMPSNIVVPDLPEKATFTPAQAISLSYELNINYAGDNRAQMMVLPFQAKVIPLDWKPTDLGIDIARNNFEERICAVLGVPPVVIGMGTGLDKSSAKASYEDSRRAAYEGTVWPLIKHIGNQIFRDLAGEFIPNPRGYRLWWDLTQVLALRESEDAKVERGTKACGGPYKTVNEVREADGLPPIEGGDKLRGTVDPASEDAHEKGDAPEEGGKKDDAKE